MTNRPKANDIMLKVEYWIGSINMYDENDIKKQFLDADQNDNRSIILSSPKGGQSCAEKGSRAISRASIQFELKSIPEFEDVKIEDEDYMTFERFKKAANMGDVEGKYNVGCCYEKGIRG
ncbi:hypothetical protein F8M41_017278 [Gigaspora margarita]|uniref:Uncharacterized protein n=1 Tax=Gigaspora margarita TaxID=4874 RepID=A0A8H4EM60_GIGMA|nr:hypothetical protein F8M41_017278 [Gigaspora margarita]